MDSWEFNKIAGAILAALLVVFGGKTLLEVGQGGHGSHEAKAGYTLPVQVADNSNSAGAAGSAPAGFEVAAVFTAMQTGSASAGEAAFKKCQACHTTNDGGKNGQGPNLWNIVDRDKGAVAGFKYSAGMTEKGGKWDFESLAHFIHNPKSWMKGTKMAFAGIKSPAELGNLLLYLRSLSASPAALPAAPAATAPAAAAAGKPKAH